MAETTHMNLMRLVDDGYAHSRCICPKDADLNVLDTRPGCMMIGLHFLAMRDERDAAHADVDELAAAADETAKDMERLAHQRLDLEARLQQVEAERDELQTRVDQVTRVLDAYPNYGGPEFEILIPKGQVREAIAPAPHVDCGDLTGHRDGCHCPPDAVEISPRVALQREVER